MLRSTILLLLFTICGSSIFGQNCLPGGIEFSSQQQIDDFADDYSGCSVIEGDVEIFGAAGAISNLNGLLGLTKIEGNLDIFLNSNLLTLDGLDNLTEVAGFISLSYSTNLTSISGLKNLVTIGGDLNIVNTNISDLNGLEKLETVTGDLEIFNNDILSSLSGIESLTSVGGNLYLEQSNLLEDVQGLKELTTIGGDFEVSYLGISDFGGLGKLTSIGGKLEISHNSALENCQGLDNLSTIGGHLYFLGNSDLTSFQGLEKLLSIGGLLTISNNDVLTDLNGLESLNSLGNYLNISWNDELTSLNGLNGLISIGGYLNIASNPKLVDISALEMIDPATIVSNTNTSEDIEINGNNLLSTCENLAICLALDSGKSSNINNNATGCNTVEEVEYECASSILPVEWLEALKVRKDKNGHLLTFATAQEVNNDMFILERSSDGKHFNGIQNINPKGNSSKEAHYSILDEIPMPGMNYYRIKQVDIDALFSYSNIAAIDNSKGDSQIQIYPNPASSELIIFNTKDEKEVKFFNYQGALIRKVNLVEGSNRIDIDDFQKGIYFVMSLDGFAEKIIVQ